MGQPTFGGRTDVQRIMLCTIFMLSLYSMAVEAYDCGGGEHKCRNAYQSSDQTLDDLKVLEECNAENDKVKCDWEDYLWLSIVVPLFLCAVCVVCAACGKPIMLFLGLAAANGS